MTQIHSTILSLFLLIILGVIVEALLLAKKGRKEKLLCKLGIQCESWTEVLNKYVLYLAFPALLISSLANIPRGVIMSWSTITFTAGILTAMFVAIFFISKLFKGKKDIKNAYLIGLLFGNIAYIGYPILTSIYPMRAGEVSILIAIHTVIIFTVGISFLEHSKYGKSNISQILLRAIKNPLLMAVFIGLLLMTLQIKLPTIVDDTIRMIGGSATPVVLIALGIFLLEHFRISKEMLHGAVIAGGKLIVLPLIFLGAAKLFGIMPTMDFSIMEAAMPVALTNFALAEIYPINKKVITNAILFSTLIALITIPLFSLLAL